MKFTKITARNFVRECECELKEQFDRVDDIALHNQEKVLKAFSEYGIQARHMFGTTGYGYDDIGRDTLAQVFARVLGAETALVSPHIVSGTHALTLMLFGVLRPGDKLLAVSGKPYDTLCDVITGKDKGSLADYGVEFDIIDLKTENKQPVFDYEEIENRLKN
ncbi:MAG: methionine gamma-lyase family protein [Clostridia bacterium]|nr:methionine gamma-lyase family protein [Clostridia bacterium]